MSKLDHLMLKSSHRGTATCSNGFSAGPRGGRGGERVWCVRMGRGGGGKYLQTNYFRGRFAETRRPGAGRSERVRYAGFTE